MKMFKIFSNCCENLGLPDDHFINLVLIVLGKPVRYDDYCDQAIIVYFSRKDSSLRISRDRRFITWNYNRPLRWGSVSIILDMRVTDKQYKSLDNYDCYRDMSW